MAFKKHEDYVDVTRLLLGRQIVGVKIEDDKVLLKFDNQDWLEVYTNENPFSTELTATFTEWVEDANDSQTD
jgi:hypothetical protein